MDQYATHQRLLIAAAMQTEGRIVEMGCGNYSTPLLAEIAASQGRQFTVCTISEEWGSKYRNIADVHMLRSWGEYPYPECGLTFLDSGEYVRNRKKHVPRLLDTSTVVVCHDMGVNEWGAEYSTSDGLHHTPTIAISRHKKILLHSHQTPVMVACVYKTGGDFTVEYVERLRDAVAVHTTRPHRFVCFTDSEEKLSCETIPLTENLPGWWSKLELFKVYRGRVVYFDLDTMIIANIDKLLNYTGPMLMMRDTLHSGQTPPDPREWNSSIMAWSLPPQFIFPPAEVLQCLRTSPSGGDQEYIAAKLKHAKMNINAAQDLVNVASYRIQCKDGVPDGTQIVHFHGNPRPHEIGWKL